MVLACLTALMNRDLFVLGATEALPFVANLAQNYPYTKMSFSQKRYLSYFNQVLLHDFTPLSRPLVLSKILINIEEQEIVPASNNSDSDSDEPAPVTTAPMMTVTDYS